MTVDHAAQGRRNRNAGHTWERACAAFLADVLDERIVTARSVSGGTGLGVDLVTLTDGEVLMHVGGWELECKASSVHKPTPWLRQASEQATSRWFAVVAKRDRKPVCDALVYLPMASYVEHVTGVRPVRDDVAVVSLGVFGELLRLPAWSEVAS